MTLHPDFTRVYTADNGEPGRVIWILFRGEEVVVRSEGNAICLPGEPAEDKASFALGEPLFLGRLDGVLYKTAHLAEETDLPPGYMGIGMRKLYGSIAEQEWLIAGYAWQILHWRRTSQFCPVCGGATEPMQKEWVRHCSHCGHSRYPQVSPAVLMLVHDGADRVLLAHKPGWGPMYSIFAGFVLPGESLEECVHREVAEEAGVRIEDLVYQGSQPWPFPHQLMIGFTARYIGGDIQIDEEELDRVEWFHAGAMPPLPPPLSLSRQILDGWVRLQPTVP